MLSPRPGGAAAAAEFPTKERAWDAPGGQLGKRAGRVNTEASQGGVVCPELHLLSHILCFRETQKRGFSLFSPLPLLLFIPLSFLPRLVSPQAPAEGLPDTEDGAEPPPWPGLAERGELRAGGALRASAPQLRWLRLGRV